MSIFIENKYTRWYYAIIESARNNPPEGYTEKHHIIPKCMGGTNEPENLVSLSARQHFICHLLLPKMTNGKHRRDSSFALWSMLYGHSKNHQRYKPSARIYEISKKKIARAISELHTGKEVSKETREKIRKKALGRSSSKKGKTNIELYGEEKAAIISQKASESSKGQIAWNKGKEHKWRKHTEESKRKISEGNKGKTFTHTDETKEKISKSMKGRENYWLKGQTPWTKIHGHTEETKEKLRNPKQKFICDVCGKSVGGKSNLDRWHNENCKMK